MKNIFSTLLLLLLTAPLSAQFSGYMGKKNLVELGMNVHVPVIYDWFYVREGGTNFYKRSGSTLSSDLDRFNPGLRLGYTRLVGSRFGIGLDFSYDAINTVSSYYDSDPNDDYYYSYDFKGENLQFRSITINPKIEFTSKGGLLPVGISHQFGIGIRLISLVEKNYLNQYVVSDGWSTTYQEEERNYAGYFTTMKPNRFVFRSINYTLHFRRPLSDRLLLNINFRYSLNLTSERVEAEYYGVTDFHDHIYTLLNKQQLSSLAQFNLGVSYAF